MSGERKKRAVPGLRERKRNGERVVMASVTDYLMAQWAERGEVDIVAVGDSLGMITYGHSNTLPITVDQMIEHTRAVRRGAPNTMNLVAMPGIRQPELTQHLINVCEERADAMAIIDMNGGYIPFTDPGAKVNLNTEEERTDAKGVDTVINNIQSRGLNSSYAATYWPWVQIQDTIQGAVLWAPPSVAALGALAFSEKHAELWFAPAGFNRGGISGGAAGIPVSGVRQRLTSEERDKLYDANINPIASFPAEGA